jgi:hypothetical protein
MRLFVAVGIVASCDEAHRLLARVMMRGKSAAQKKSVHKFGGGSPPCCRGLEPS